MDERLWFLEHRVESTLFRHLENPFSDQTQTKTELCGLYTRDGTPPGFTWSYLLSVSSNYHPAICFGMLTTCPLLAMKRYFGSAFPFQGIFSSFTFICGVGRYLTITQWQNYRTHGNINIFITSSSKLKLGWYEKDTLILCCDWKTKLFVARSNCKKDAREWSNAMVRWIQ